MKKLISRTFLIIICTLNISLDIVGQNHNTSELNPSNSDVDCNFILENSLEVGIKIIREIDTSDILSSNYGSVVEEFNIDDYNSDGKKDQILNMGECGTGGCMYAIFLNQKDNCYTLAYYGYINDVEFSLEKDGSYSITSYEEAEAYNPSKIYVTKYKLNPIILEYQKDTSYLHLDETYR